MTEAGHRIEIQFGKSRSVNYNEAVGICEASARRSDVSSFNTRGRGEATTHTFSTKSLSAALQVWDVVKSWNTSSMTLDGRGAQRSDLTRTMVNDLKTQNQSWVTGSVWLVGIVVLLFAALTGEWSCASDWMSH